MAVWTVAVFLQMYRTNGPLAAFATLAMLGIMTSLVWGMWWFAYGEDKNGEDDE